MSSDRDVKFGLFLSLMFGLPPFDFLLDMALNAETHGFDSVWVPDHLFTSPSWVRFYHGDPDKLGLLEPWITLAAIAARTQRIRLGTLVTPIPLRNPGILAKMAATVDNISGGRLNLGVGAGWNKNEFLSYGIPWSSFRVRVRMLLEGVELIKKLWVEDGPVDFQGEYYHLDGAPFWPKPVQKPHPPIFFGGASQAILRASGKLGDGWVPHSPTPEAFAEGMSIIRRFAKRYGRRDTGIIAGAVFQCIIAENHDDAVSMAKQLLWPSEGIEERGIIGSPDECAEKIERYVEAGTRYFILSFPNREIALNSLKFFSERVISRFTNAL